jgi:hypothetical protein
MGKTSYTDPIDAITKTRIRVKIPEAYEPAGIHPYYLKTGAPPIFSGADGNMCNARLSPYKIAEAINDGHTVQFTGYGGMLTFTTILSAFLEALPPDERMSPEQQVLAEQFKKAHAVVSRMVEKTNHRNEGRAEKPAIGNTVADLADMLMNADHQPVEIKR